MMDRRSFLAGLAIASAATPAVAEPTIPDMYLEWLAIKSKPAIDKSDDELDQGAKRYQALQQAIIEAEPRTPRDVAIMLLVDTDDGESTQSFDFECRIRQLAAA